MEDTCDVPSAEEVDAWARIVQMKGYHVVEHALPLDFVQLVKEKYMSVFESHRKKVRANRGTNRWQMCVPLEHPFIDDKLLANTCFLPVVKKVLGDDCILGLFSSHVSMPGCRVQQVHIDYEPLFENYLPLPAYCVYVHIPLVDLTEDNGPTEFWPGSPHLAISNTIKSLADFDKLPLSSLPTEKPLVKAGGAIIKDMRCLHRGTPNDSEEVRPVLSLIYCKKWYRIPHEQLYADHGYPPMSISRDVFDELPHHSRHLLRFVNIKDAQPSNTDECGSEEKDKEEEQPKPQKHKKEEKEKEGHDRYTEWV